MTLLSLLADLTRHDPHSTIAIDVDPRQPAYVSRTELWRRALQLRADLATAGVGRGDGVVLCLPNWSDVLEWHVATASLGAHVIGLAPAEDNDVITQVLEQSRPRVVALAHGFGPADLPTRLRDATLRAGNAAPTVAAVAGPHGTPPIDPSPYDLGGGAWLPSITTAGMPMPVTTGDELAVVFTPSLAAHRESAVVQHALATATALGLSEDDVLLCTRPLTDVLGFSTAMAAVASGATCLLDPVMDAGTVLNHLVRFAVTHLIADDDLLLALASQWLDTRPALPAWRWLGVVDATGRSTEVASWAEQEWGVPAIGLYGSAHVLAPAALWSPGSPTPHRWSAGGHPVSADIEIRVVDPVSQQPCPGGQPGELQFRGFNTADAYLGTSGATVQRLTDDGWLATGDRAAMIGENSFRYRGNLG